MIVAFREAKGDNHVYLNHIQHETPCDAWRMLRQ